MHEPTFYNLPMLSDWLEEIPPRCRGLGMEDEYIAFKCMFPNGSWDEFAQRRMLVFGTAPLPQRERTREEELALWLAEHDTGDLNAEERQQLSIGIAPRLTPRRFFVTLRAATPDVRSIRRIFQRVPLEPPRRNIDHLRGRSWRSRRRLRQASRILLSGLPLARSIAHGERRA